MHEPMHSLLVLFWSHWTTTRYSLRRWLGFFAAFNITLHHNRFIMFMFVFIIITYLRLLSSNFPGQSYIVFVTCVVFIVVEGCFDFMLIRTIVKIRYFCRGITQSFMHHIWSIRFCITCTEGTAFWLGCRRNGTAATAFCIRFNDIPPVSKSLQYIL